ncbi:MAG: alpha/beta hydrolase fold domain-containing protein [Planctomycetota bacterium]
MKLTLTVVGLLALSAGSALAQEEKINDGFLLRQYERHPAADSDKNGRLSAEEWREFRGKVKLSAEMAEDEAAASTVTGARGKPVPPTHKEVAYGPLPEQRLNLWIVPSEKTTPLIIHIHGGGFIQGSKHSTIDSALHGRLQAAGVSYASIQYRFQSKENPLPDVLRGIARAVQFLRHRSDEWNLDKKRFGAFGSSAGAAASTWLAMRDDLADVLSSDPVLRESTRLQAVWAMSVAPTMDVWEWPQYNPLFSEKMISSWIKRWGYDPDTNPNDPAVLAWRKELRFSQLASEDDAPMVIFNEHFADNVAHNPQASKHLFDICQRAGIKAELYMREVVNNLDSAPDKFDWLIERLQR